MTKLGIFAIDPGGHTGLAWAVLDPGADGIAEALAARQRSGSATITGDERAQVLECVSLWSAFYANCVRSAQLSEDRIWLVCEDFIYSSGNTYGGDSASISTALIWGIEGFRMGRASTTRGKKPLQQMIMQTAAQAKTYATDQRLRDWGIWVKGRDHERSAWRHVALFLSRYMLQRGSS